MKTIERQRCQALCISKSVPKKVVGKRVHFFATDLEAALKSDHCSRCRQTRAALCKTAKTPASLIIFPLTAAVNYSPGLRCRDELRCSGIKALEEEDEIIKSQ